MKYRHWLLAVVLCGWAAPTARATSIDAPAYPQNLAVLVRESKHIIVLQVVDVSPQEGIILFKQVSDLKVKKAAAAMPARAALVPPGSPIMRWAEPGRLALAFHMEHGQVACVGNAWFEIRAPDWRALTKLGDRDWGTTYVGSVDTLIGHVKELDAGREVVLGARTPFAVPDRSGVSWYEHDCPPQMQLDWPRGKKGRVCRLRVSPNRDRPPEIVGWGLGGGELVPGLVKALRHPDGLMRAAATEDLGQLGPSAGDAIAPLRDRLQDADAHVRLFAAEALAAIQPEKPVEIEIIRAGLKHADPAVRIAAISVLANLEARAQAAVPDLLAVLGGDRGLSVREAAAYALGEIGPEATRAGCGADAIVPALAERLAHEGDLASWAGKALGRFGPAARPALPALRRAVGSGTAADAVAQDVLSRLGPAGVAALADALENHDPVVPELLRQIGPRGRAAIPALMGRLKDKDLWSAYPAARALLAIDRKLATPVVVPALVDLLKTEDEKRKTGERGIDGGIILFQLAELGPDAHAVVPLLLPYVEHGQSVVEALGAIGPRARAALPALKAALANEDLAFRFAAAEALWRISGDASAALPVWRAALCNPTNSSLREQALRFPRNLGIVDKQTVLDLAGCLKEKQDEYDRHSLLKALTELGPEAKGAAPALQNFLQQEKNPAVRLPALVALACVDPGNAQALAALQAALHDRDDGVRLQAVAALSQAVQPLSRKYERQPPVEFVRPIVPLLQDTLGDANLNVRRKATEVLGILGPEAKAAVPALVSALQDLNPDMRLAAVTALVRIEPQHDAIVPAVGQLLAQAPGLFYPLSSTLADLGPRARPVVPQVLRLNRNLPVWESMIAIDLLEKIDPPAAARLWPREEAGPAAFSAKQLDTLWADLGTGNTPAGYRAYWKLVLAPQPPLAFLKDRLMPVPKTDADQVVRWVADLESNRFEVRQKATASLERIEQVAEPALRRALAAQPALEVRQRLERLLDKLDPAKCGERQRLLWCVEILERIGTPAAREVLQGLASGASEARLTRDAQGALNRLLGTGGGR
jgi:HEAT repeat protein